MLSRNNTKLVSSGRTIESHLRLREEPIRGGILIASIVMMIATLLPYCKINMYIAAASTSLIQGDGIFYIILGAFIILFTYLRKRTLIMVFSLLSFLVYCIDTASLPSFAIKQIGFYIITLSVVALIGLNIYSFIKERKSKRIL